MDIPGETASAEDIKDPFVEVAHNTITMNNGSKIVSIKGKEPIKGGPNLTVPKIAYKCEMIKQWKVKECKMRKCPYYSRECDDL